MASNFSRRTAVTSGDDAYQPLVADESLAIGMDSTEAHPIGLALGRDGHQAGGARSETVRAGSITAQAAQASGGSVSYMPSDHFGVPWHIDDAIHVQSVWPQYTGAGIKVGVYDEGVQYTHPDLNDNYNSALHFTFNGKVQDPGVGPGVSRPHGTSVAGIIAAENNGQGTVGVAYGASLTGVLALNAGYSGQQMFDYYQDSMAYARNFDVTNNSYGYDNPFSDIAIAPTWELPLHYGTARQSSIYTARQAGMEAATEQGRDGLGTLFVVAAGNTRIAKGMDNNKDGKIDGTVIKGLPNDTITNEASDANVAGGHVNSRANCKTV